MSKTLTFTLMLGLAVALGLSHASAGLILGNTFDGSTNNADPYSAGQQTDANVTSVGVGRPGYTNNGGFNALVAGELRGFVQPINTGTRYFSFEITPINGAEIDFTDFDYNGFTTLASGSSVEPDLFQLRSSVDNYSSAIPGAGPTGGTVDLSGAAFQGITSQIGFRLYVQADDNASPNTTYSLDDFAFNGTVTAIPEPSSLVALSLAGVGCLIAGRRRNRLSH